MAGAAHRHIGKDAAEICPVHQIEQFRVVSQINAGFGGEPERILVLLHPGHDLLEERLGLLFVADEVVIDDEGRMEASLPEIIEFGDQLLRLLHPRLTAVDDDDVAEFALERAAS